MSANASAYSSQNPARRRPLKVLYVHPAGQFGGASKSLLDTIAGLEAVQAKLICPHGQVASLARAQGIDVIEVIGLSQLDNSSFGGYRGLRKVVLLREAALIPITVSALFKARMRWPLIDIVHINEITLVLLVPLIRIFYPGVPVIVHVRSTQSSVNNSFKSRLIFSIISRYVARIVPIDETVNATLFNKFAATVIHNGFSIPPETTNASSRVTNKSSAPLVLSYVGGLMAAKGIFDLLEAARICKERRLNLHWRIFGENVRTVSGIRGCFLRWFGLHADVRGQVLSLIRQYGLDGIVTLEGHQSNYEKIYGETDVVLCITHANAAGRPVFEGAFFGRPSIVAIADPISDTVIEGITAVCIPARSPNRLADAAAMLEADRSLVERMGRAAATLAHRNFEIGRCSVRLLDLYDEVTSRCPSMPTSAFKEPLKN
jgi:glycosyltransferase involved in cell wall biosynthesis